MNADLDQERSNASETESLPRAGSATERSGSAAASAGRSASTATKVRSPGPRRPVTAKTDRGLGRRLPWVLALLGLIGTVGFAIAWHGAEDGPGPAPTASADGEAASMADGATAFTEALTNFDGATIDRDFDRIVALSTGEFRGQADDFFSSKVRKQLKEAQASSRGEIRSAYVQSFDDDRGSVFVVLDQTIANNKSPKPKADTLRMELTMARTGGRWLVSRVDVLTAPSGADTIGSAAEATPTTTGG
ncbi:hypothetical protein BH10ACT1_BH10ACT1_27240 [soil metagenome]